MKQSSLIELLRNERAQKVIVPIIQRDYAQGRQDDVVTRIRRSFLGALHEAVVGERQMSLDFVYGEMSGGAFVPLDGQQRLTTLFLLHWYISAGASIPISDSAFLGRFTYETRYSSRDFCARLVNQRPQFPLASPISDWIRDQSWFFSAWRHDPTIQSMLVVLDDIQKLFDGIDFKKAWARLSAEADPPVVFHVLPIEDMGLTDDLYIKMNSRGKPLTRFEHFKAYFEKLLKDSSPQRYQEFIDKVDNSWADIFWPLRGANDIIDDEFVRYFRFVCDLLVYWNVLNLEARRDGELETVSMHLFGPQNAKALDNQRFLFHSFDCWLTDDAKHVFGRSLTKEGHEPGKVCVFDSIELFRDCANSYISPESEGRGFGLQRMLLLFGVLVHLVEKTGSFPARVRHIRNLIQASSDELRVYNLSRLLQDSYEIVCSGDLGKVERFNQRQKAEEVAKETFLAASPSSAPILLRLEDHTLLRGCLAAFELDDGKFERRANEFLSLFPESGEDPLPELSGALLACGDYSQPLPRFPGRYQFGSINTGQPVWRELFTNPANKGFDRTRTSLLQLLDELSLLGGEPVRGRLKHVIDSYLSAQEERQQFDWRYYLVKYPAMREGLSGIYVSSEGEMGFSLCMLDRRRMSSNYRDPYLQAIVRKCNARSWSDIADPLFTGYETGERWLQLNRSGLRFRCVASGFQFAAPQSEEQREAIATLSSRFTIEDELLIKMSQVKSSGNIFDTEDRVVVGARLVGEILSASD